MPKLDFPLSQAPYSAPYSSIGAEVLDNFYLERAASPTAKAPYYQVGRQGLRRIIARTNGNACRGMVTTSSGRTFGVWGGAISELTNQGATRSQRGTLLTTAGVVRFAENGYQLIAVDGKYGYILDLTSGAWARITDEYFPGVGQTNPTSGPTHVACIDTYFIVNSKGTNRYYWSAPYYKPYAFDTLHPEVLNLWWGLQYGQKVGDTDQIQAIISNVNLLWVIGQNSMEVHEDTGNTTGQLFSRVSNALIGFGCLAPDSLCKYGNSVFWLGRDRSGTVGMFMAGTDFQPQRISLRGIETRIQAYASLEDCWAYTYAIDGHAFVVWNFPNGTSVDGGEVAGATWVFDVTSSAWYRFYNWDTGAGKATRWAAQWVTYNWSKLIVGDGSSNAVYELDGDYFEDDKPDAGSDLIVGAINSPIIQQNNCMMMHRSVQLNMQQGVGQRTGEGSDPYAMMSASDDAGVTYGYERPASVGRTGDYAARTRWPRCGSGRMRVYRFRITIKCRRVINGITIEAEVKSR